jgi:hypothetical protein
MNEEILEMINERRKYKNATDQRGKEKYGKLKNAINRECKKSKEVFLNNICQDIDEALKVGLMDKAYGIVRTFFKERKVKITSIKEANGNIIYEEAEVAKCWKKYLEQLYREENMTIDAEINEEHQNNTEEIDQSIMREEFDKALVELKNKKAPGVDEIPAELIQNCGKNTKKIIYEIIKECYETGQVPSDFTKCIIVPIPKKNNSKNM